MCLCVSSSSLSRARVLTWSVKVCTLSLKYNSSSFPLNPPPLPLCPPTFPDVPVRRPLKLPGAQQEAGSVVGVALAAGGRAEAPGGRAALVAEDLVDGGTVLVGQSSRAGGRVAVLLGVWETQGRWTCGATRDTAEEMNVDV